MEIEHASLAGLLTQLISLAWSLMPVIGMWLVFEKAGEQGWKAISPFYNTYTVMKLGKKKKFFVWHVISFVLMSIAAAYLFIVLFAFIFAAAAAGGDMQKTMGLLNEAFPYLGVALIVLLVSMVLNYFCNYQACFGISKKMGQGGAITVGLVLLPQVFWLLLGLNPRYQWQEDDPFDQFRYYMDL